MFGFDSQKYSPSCLVSRAIRSAEYCSLTASSIAVVSCGAKLAEDTDKRTGENAFKKGDLAAFDMLFAKYQVKVLNLVARYVRDQEEVKDVTPRRLSSKPIAHYLNFAAIARFIRGSYRIAINTAKKPFSYPWSSSTSGTDVDIDDSGLS